MSSLSEVCTPRPVGGRYQLDVAPGWRMGRGAFGGLVVGALARAIDHHTADPARRIRSLTAELPGPVEHGLADITVETLRRGNNVSTVRAVLSQGDEIRSHAVAIVAADRSRRGVAGGTGGTTATTWNDLVRPAAPAWSEVDALERGPAGPWPEFAQHFEYRLVDGMPGSGSRQTLGWIRARDPGPRLDAGYIAAMVDAWFPVAFPRIGPRAMATIAFTLDIAGGVDGLDPAAPLLYRATAPVCTDGYMLETRELWGSDGRLVAINHQTFVII